MFWKICKFYEGLSDNKYIGTTYSLADMVSADIFSEIPFIKCSQKLKKISTDTIVTDLIIRFVPVGSYVFAFGDTGRIYLINGTTVTFLHDTGSAILDASYFWGDLYWTTSTKLGKCSAQYITESDWTSHADDDWISTEGETALTSQSYHPLYAIGDRLFIGDGRWVDMVAISSDTPEYNSHSLDVKSDWVIRSLTLLKPLLLIGVESNGTGKLVSWDFINADDSYNPVPGLEQGVCDGFLNVDGIIYATIGKSLYWFNGITPIQVKELDSSVRSGARTIYNGSPYYGTSKIYTWDRKNKNYNYVLDKPFTTSTSPVDIIGAMAGTSNNLFVSWKKGSTYGIDCIDNNNKAVSIIESRVLEGDNKLSVKNIKYFFEPLESGEKIQLKYKIDNGEWKSFKNSAGEEIISETEGSTSNMISFSEQCRSLQIQAILTPYGNNSPVLKRIIVDITPIERAF